ncbi:MAG: ABC transporter permease [Gammaproteobacteria bacterium]|nr:ABC transporter permease [Gammaproteobacteria bacterium]MDH3411510.1 ABC transporter permease [Gammaproteobacteria bacterium]
MRRQHTYAGLVRLGLRGLAATGSVIALLIAWELFARAEVVSAFLLPPLTLVLERIGKDLISGALPVQLGLTLYRAVAGFTLAALFGILIGVLMARSKSVSWFFDPIVSIGFPAPKIAFLPVFILWFGLFDLSKILMTVFAAIFPVIGATAAATEGVDKYLIWSARNAGASEGEILWEVVLPAAMPQIITGLQVALPISLIVTIVSEMVMGGEGLGGNMIGAARFADSVGVFAGIVQIAIAGYLLIKGLELIRQGLLVWHQETQQLSTF